MYETGGSPYSSDFQKSLQQQTKKRDHKNIETPKGLGTTLNKLQPSVPRYKEDD
jgi:hypothetical protein